MGRGWRWRGEGMGREIGDEEGGGEGREGERGWGGDSLMK